MTRAKRPPDALAAPPVVPQEAPPPDPGPEASAQPDAAGAATSAPPEPPDAQLVLPRLEPRLGGPGAELWLGDARVAGNEEWVAVVPLLFLELPDESPRFVVLVPVADAEGPRLAAAVATFTGPDRGIGEELVDAALKPGPEGATLDLHRRMWSLRAIRSTIGRAGARAAWGCRPDAGDRLKAAAALTMSGAADRLHAELAAALGAGQLVVAGDAH